MSHNPSSLKKRRLKSPAAVSGQVFTDDGYLPGVDYKVLIGSRLAYNFHRDDRRHQFMLPNGKIRKGVVQYSCRTFFTEKGNFLNFDQVNRAFDWLIEQGYEVGVEGALYNDTLRLKGLEEKSGLYCTSGFDRAQYVSVGKLKELASEYKGHPSVEVVKPGGVDVPSAPVAVPGFAQIFRDYVTPVNRPAEKELALSPLAQTNILGLPVNAETKQVWDEVDQGLRVTPDPGCLWTSDLGDLADTGIDDESWISELGNS